MSLISCDFPNINASEQSLPVQEVLIQHNGCDQKNHQGQGADPELTRPVHGSTVAQRMKASKQTHICTVSSVRARVRPPGGGGGGGRLSEIARGNDTFREAVNLIW